MAALQTVLLAQGVSTRARWMLEAFREGMAQLGTVYEGGDAPSSGFIGIYFLLQVRLGCVLGLGLGLGLGCQGLWLGLGLGLGCQGLWLGLGLGLGLG